MWLFKYRAKAGRAIPVFALLLSVLMLTLPSSLPALDGIEGEQARSGFYVDIGLGPGLFSWIDPDTGEGLPTDFSLGFDVKTGFHISEQLSLFMLSHINFHNFSIIGDYTRWIFDDEDNDHLRKMLIPTIPFAVLLESQLLTGPGITYHFSSNERSLYIEGGLGLSCSQSVTNNNFMLGNALFAGFGMDLSSRLACAVRLVYSSSWMSKLWTDMSYNTLTVLAVFYFF